MRAVVQRVTKSSVEVEGEKIGEVGMGYMVLLGVGNEDTTEDADYLARKIVNLRVFEDEEGKMNKSILDVGGEMLVISQFTLYGDARKGNRPSFSTAARPETGNELYEYFTSQVENHGIRVEKGSFGAHMDVSLVNSGPVTILFDSKRTF